jgi:RNA polymerase primary sigma factor
MNFEKSESIALYFKSIKSFDPLTKEEESQLAILIQAGDRLALEKLIRHNLKIVVTIANKNANRGIQVDDLIQEGNIGLLDAAQRFLPDSKVRFASFASTRVLKYMNSLIDQCGRAVRIPVNQEYQRYLSLKKGEEVEDISTVKLDSFVFEDSKDRKSDRYVSVQPEVEEMHEFEFLKVETDQLLSRLSERERSIVEMFYGIGQDEEMETKEIAKKVGLSQIRICQILSAAKKKMKEDEE